MHNSSDSQIPSSISISLKVIGGDRLGAVLYGREKVPHRRSQLHCSLPKFLVSSGLLLSITRRMAIIEASLQGLREDD